MTYAGINVKNSTNPDIASNYGLDCQGIRLPGTANSNYQLQGKLNYSFGTGSRIFVSALASQAQGRNFTYANLYNPQSIFGFTGNNQVYTLGWTQNLAKSSARALALDVIAVVPAGPVHPVAADPGIRGEQPRSVRRLHDLAAASTSSTSTTSRSTRSCWTTSSRTSRARGASPYDLDNTSQYALVDKWRNNAYGLLGFSEAGGPTGRHHLLNQENRFLGSAALDWQVDRYNRLKLGGGFTKYDMKSYASALTSQFFSDFFMEKPTAYTGFAEDRLDLGDVVLVAGLRYDYYNSNASHPQYCDSDAASCQPDRPDLQQPAVRPEQRARRRSTRSTRPTSRTTTSSPHIQVSFPVSDRTNMRFSYAHQVQAAGLRRWSSGGINTDLGVTNTNQTSTARTSTSARRSPSSSASGTPSRTTWCSTSRRTTATCRPTRPAACLTLYDPLELQNARRPHA